MLSLWLFVLTSGRVFVNLLLLRAAVAKIISSVLGSLSKQTNKQLTLCQRPRYPFLLWLLPLPWRLALWRRRQRWRTNVCSLHQPPHWHRGLWIKDILTHWLLHVSHFVFACWTNGIDMLSRKRRAQDTPATHFASCTRDNTAVQWVSNHGWRHNSGPVGLQKGVNQLTLLGGAEGDGGHEVGPQKKRGQRERRQCSAFCNWFLYCGRDFKQHIFWWSEWHQPVMKTLAYQHLVDLL